MRYDLGYWNPKKLLPYQRNFNFVNSIRKVGKSYSLAGFFMERFLKYGEESIFLSRTQDEIKGGILFKWWDKVIKNEFPQLNIVYKNDIMYLQENKKLTTIMHARSLTQVMKIKKETCFSNVYWGVMDEYMLEPMYFYMYVKGWNEPDIFLNIYDTIDRDENRCKFFLLGNNTAFYNPYHIHQAFKIPPTPPGKIWKSKKVLFQNFEPSEEFKEKYLQSDFNEMVKDTGYGKYAHGGEYSDDYSFIKKREGIYTYSFAFAFEKDIFGVWCSRKNKDVIISNRYNNTMIFRIDGRPVEGHYQMTSDNYLKKWLSKMYALNKVFFESMDIKVKADELIQKKIIK